MRVGLLEKTSRSSARLMSSMLIERRGEENVSSLPGQVTENHALDEYK